METLSALHDLELTFLILTGLTILLSSNAYKDASVALYFFLAGMLSLYMVFSLYTNFTYNLGKDLESLSNSLNMLKNEPSGDSMFLSDEEREIIYKNMSETSLQKLKLKLSEISADKRIYVYERIEFIKLLREKIAVEKIKKEGLSKTKFKFQDKETKEDFLKNLQSSEEKETERRSSNKDRQDLEDIPLDQFLSSISIPKNNQSGE